MSYFYDIVEEIITIEGNYTNDPADSGGETKWGITKESARRAGYTGDMRDLTKQQAIDIYKTLYWDKLSLDIFANDSEHLAYELFDVGVNMGPPTAGVFLQRILNVMNDKEEYYNDIIVDGAVGPNTLNAYNQYKNLRGTQGIKVLTTLINCLQGARYVSLAEQREKDERFVYGWAKNRL